VVFGSEAVGLPDVFQQTPRAVTAPPLSSVIVPPETAFVNVTPVTAAVVSVGTRIGLVVKNSSLP
jgi:hypothetical protein